MRPQQKPFVVEIKKTRRLRTKPLPIEPGRGGLTMPKGSTADAGVVLQREDRA